MPQAPDPRPNEGPFGDGLDSKPDPTLKVPSLSHWGMVQCELPSVRKGMMEIYCGLRSGALDPSIALSPQDTDMGVDRQSWRKFIF